MARFGGFDHAIRINGIPIANSSRGRRSAPRADLFEEVAERLGVPDAETVEELLEEFDRQAVEADAASAADAPAEDALVRTAWGSTAAEKSATTGVTDISRLADLAWGA